MTWQSLKKYLYVLSLVLVIEGLSFLLCVPFAWYYHETAVPFYISSLMTVAGGVLLYLLSDKKHSDSINRHEGYFLVVITWVIFILIGTIPFVLSNTIPSFIDNIFETTSGFTTAGSSILTDIEALPKSILFWRSMTHWLGGVGIIVLVVVVLPSMNTKGFSLFTFESSLHEKIVPRFRSIGKRVILIYFVLSASLTILLLAGGMNLFESLCHSFGTIATGGFSPKNDSIAGYSPYIQYVMAVFMVLSGINYAYYYYLFIGKTKSAFQLDEVKFFIKVVVISTFVVFLIVYMNMDKGAELSFREAFFQVASVISCTGFATADYLAWPMAGWLILFLLMFAGGCSGSTSGGIKMSRILIMFRNLSMIFKKAVNPNAVLLVRYNGKTIDDNSNNTLMVFVVVFVLVFITGTISLFITGVDLETSAGSVVSAMSSVGPGLGTTGPVSNYAHIPDAGKLILSAIMLIGRLEIYAVLLLFTPAFWKK